MADYSRSVKQLLKMLLDRMDSSYQKTIGYPTYDILNAVAMVLKRLYDKIQEYYLKLDVDNLTDEELTRFVLQHKGIVRKEATKATVLLTITGNGTIKAGSVFQTAFGVQFATKEDVTINGSGTVLAEAVVAGVLGNVAAGSIIAMPVTVQGVTAVTNEEPAAGGYDMESDDLLRERYYDALRKPATSGNIYHYEQWAKSVTGVGKAKVYPLWAGENTVQVVIVDSNGEPASEDLVQTVQEYIDPGSKGLGEGEAPVGAYCTVTAAEALSVNIRVILLGNSTPEIQEAIKESIKKYLSSIAFEQNYVSYARIGDAILETEGVIDYMDLTVNGDVKNIQVPDKAVAVLGGVEYVELDEG